MQFQYNFSHSAKRHCSQLFISEALFLWSLCFLVSFLLGLCWQGLGKLRAEAYRSQDVKCKGANRLGWLQVLMAPTGLLLFWVQFPNRDCKFWGVFRNTFCKGTVGTAHQQKQSLQSRSGLTGSNINIAHCFQRNLFLVPFQMAHV